MNVSNGMEVVEGQEELFDNSGGVTLCEEPAGQKNLEELATACQVRNEVVVLLCLNEVLERDDVRMIDSLEDINFTTEHLLLVCIRLHGVSFGTQFTLEVQSHP